MMTARELMTQKLYEDAAMLHRLHTERPLKRDRFLNYWLDQDCFK